MLYLDFSLSALTQRETVCLINDGNIRGIGITLLPFLVPKEENAVQDIAHYHGGASFI